MANNVCNCGKGYASIWDNKCGNCRTSKEQVAHQKTLYDVLQENPGTTEDAIKFYREIRGIK